MPELYGKNGWTMVYRDGNFSRTYNGKILCSALFGGIADAIASFARSFT
jgi:hypothetical protein